MEILLVNKDTAQANIIHEFMLSVDADFDPPIAERVDLLDYSRRLVEKSEVFVAWIDGSLVAVSACYCNDFHTRIGDLSYLAVSSSARKRGIAGELIRRTIERARTAGMSAITTKTPARNARLVQFYEGLGFLRVGVGAPRPDGSLSVLLRLELPQ